MNLKRLAKPRRLAMAVESAIDDQIRDYVEHDYDIDIDDTELTALEQYVGLLTTSLESNDLAVVVLGRYASIESFSDKAKMVGNKLLESFKALWELLVKFTKSVWDKLTSNHKQVVEDLESQGDEVELSPEAVEALRGISFNKPIDELGDSSVSTERYTEVHSPTLQTDVKRLERAHASYYGHGYSKIDCVKEKQKLNGLGKAILNANTTDEITRSGKEYLEELARYASLSNDLESGKTVSAEFPKLMEQLSQLLSSLKESDEVDESLRDGIYQTAKRIISLVKSGSLHAPLKAHFDLRSGSYFKVDVKRLTHDLGSLITAVSEQNKRVKRIDDEIRKLIQRAKDSSTVELAGWWKIPLFIERDIVSGYQRYVLAGQQYLREVFLFRKKYAAKQGA